MRREAEEWHGAMGGQRPWAASDVTNVYNVRDKSVDHERLILLPPATPLLAAALLTPPCASPWTAGVQRCRPLDWTGLFAAHAGRPELDVRPRRRRGRALCVPGLRSAGINQNVGGTGAQCVKSSSCGGFFDSIAFLFRNMLSHSQTLPKGGHQHWFLGHDADFVVVTYEFLQFQF